MKIFSIFMNNADDILRIIETVVARFCHDLAGTVGTILNSLEMLKDDNKQLHFKAMELVEESSVDACNKIKLMSNAYGPTSNLEKIGLLDYMQSVINFLKNRNITITYKKNIEDIVVVEIYARLIVNFLILMADFIGRDGSLDIMFDLNKVIIFGKGSKMQFDKNICKILLDGFKDKVNVKNINIYLLYLLVVILGIKPDFNYSKNAASIDFKIPKNSFTGIN